MKNPLGIKPEVIDSSVGLVLIRTSSDRPLCWREPDFPGLIRTMPNWITVCLG